MMPPIPMRPFAKLLSWAFFSAICLAAPTITTAAESADDPLAHLRPNHPRLLFTDDDLAKALAAAKTDPLRAELNKHIIATAEHILNTPPLRQPDNVASSEQDRYAVYNILNCAMAYRLTGDEKFFF